MKKCAVPNLRHGTFASGTLLSGVMAAPKNEALRPSSSLPMEKITVLKHPINTAIELKCHCYVMIFWFTLSPGMPYVCERVKGYSDKKIIDISNGQTCSQWALNETNIQKHILTISIFHFICYIIRL